MDQQDIFALFDYNLAYEIRLADALESVKRKFRPRK